MDLILFNLKLFIKFTVWRLFQNQCRKNQEIIFLEIIYCNSIFYYLFQFNKVDWPPKKYYRDDYRGFYSLKNNTNEKGTYFSHDIYLHCHEEGGQQHLITGSITNQPPKTTMPHWAWMDHIKINNAK